MARTPKNLAIGTIAATTLTSIYTAPSGINTTISVLRFTNNTDDNISIVISKESASTDYIQDTITLPAGISKARIYHGFQREVVNAGQIIKVQADVASSFNYDLSGSEVEV